MCQYTNKSYVKIRLRCLPNIQRAQVTDYSQNVEYIFTTKCHKTKKHALKVDDLANVGASPSM